MRQLKSFSTALYFEIDPQPEMKNMRMTHTITIKNHGSVTKTSPEHLPALIGQRADSELSPDDGAGLDVANQQIDDNPFRRMIGIGIRRRPTAEIMRETRGEDSMR